MDEKPCYYFSCKGCTKKVTGDYCEHCGEDKGTKTVYMFDVKISDGTGSVWMRIFEEQGEELLGLTADEIKEINEIDNEQYRKMLNKPIGQVI